MNKVMTDSKQSSSEDELLKNLSKLKLKATKSDVEVIKSSASPASTKDKQQVHGGGGGGKSLERKSNSSASALNQIKSPHLYGDGYTWNRYLFKEDLGNGSYGLVKLVHNREDNNLYAMKILSKRKLVRQAGFARRPPRKGAIKRATPLDRVYQEIALLKKLNHPNVVKLVEVFDDPNEDDLCMVFELMPHGEVMSVPCDDPFDEETARKYFKDTLLGLEYLHHQKIIHRDIKPSNLLLDNHGNVKIADLGVSQQLDGCDDLISGTAGTPAFMPPESISTSIDQFQGRPLDVWSFGCTLYCFLTGRPPFHSENIMQLHQLISEKEVEFSTPLSKDVKDLLMKMLKKDPKERITLKGIRAHPWVTDRGRARIPEEHENCHLVTVTDEDVKSSVTSIPKLHTLIMVKSMLKHRTFRSNPRLKKS